MGLLICDKCGGSYTIILRDNQKVYRCPTCGNETTEAPSNKVPKIQRNWEKKGRDAQ